MKSFSDIHHLAPRTPLFLYSETTSIQTKFRFHFLTRRGEFSVCFQPLDPPSAQHTEIRTPTGGLVGSLIYDL